MHYPVLGAYLLRLNSQPCIGSSFRLIWASEMEERLLDWVGPIVSRLALMMIQMIDKLTNGQTSRRLAGMRIIRVPEGVVQHLNNNYVGNLLPRFITTCCRALVGKRALSSYCCQDNCVDEANICDGVSKYIHPNTLIIDDSTLGKLNVILS